MKKIINRPEAVANEMLRGFALAHPEVELLPKYKTVVRKRLNPNKVCLISGGGSGHEPTHAGFVGVGMLDAAVAGDIFASPSQIQVYQAIKAVAGEKGVLLIIKNYSGDVMNFENAAHLASEDDIIVDYVKVDDDIAVEDSLYTVGRRGVAGTIFVHKIAGAAAEQGMNLSEVKRVAEKTVANARSIGFALTSCTTPSKGSPTFDLEEDRMEYGVGIHGEPGVRREPLRNAAELAEGMVAALCDELGLDGTAGAERSERVALLVNGFGGTPLMELYLLHHDVRKELAAREIEVHRSLVGNFMTSIDMAGASVTLLRLDDELAGLLDAPAQTPALHITGPVPCVGYEAAWDPEQSGVGDMGIDVDGRGMPGSFSGDGMVVGGELTLQNLIYIVDVMCASIIRNEEAFCELDSHAGDGDFGMSIAKGFRQLKREWNSIIEQDGLDMGGFLDACSMVIMEHCGGASGPIWGSAFRAAGKQAKGRQSIGVSEFAEILQAAVRGIQAVGERSFGRGAVVGDKTLIDALVPCADAWTACGEHSASFAEAFKAGAEAAVAGAKATENIVARMGRAGNVGERSLGYPDAGAHGLGVIFTDVSEALCFR
ncbi:MAG: dihydroxyacetone kinase subunit DhaK [Clostridiales bacterium]|nr:dihydroxyacetone kinase subunit DhaK [Clostridiales bacterium]